MEDMQTTTMTTTARSAFRLPLSFRRTTTSTPAAEWRTMATDAQRLTSQLPILRDGWGPSNLHRYADAALALEAAVWEAARRHEADVTTACTGVEVADRLSRAAAIVPPARDAVSTLSALLDAGANGEIDDLTIETDAVRAADRLIGYLELRARMG
jgi:hypothetical protein